MTIALLAVLGHLVHVPFRSCLLKYVYVALWVFIAIYVVPTIAWAYDTVLSLKHESPSREYGADDVQVRILTVDAEDVVQNTVDELPSTFDDVHVVAEAPLDVEGAIVHVVPEEFECETSRKSRALEWARRKLVCEREYVLFLDEDTPVTEFDQLRNSDTVQFRNSPT